MKSITKRIISTLAICGALVLEAGATAIGSLGKALNNIAKVDAASLTSEGSIEAKSGAFSGWTSSLGSAYKDGSAKFGSTGSYTLNKALFSGTVSSGMTKLEVTVNGKLNGTDSDSNSYTVYALDKDGKSLGSNNFTGKYGTSYVNKTFTISSGLTNCAGIKVEYTNKASGNWGVTLISWKVTYDSGSSTSYSVTYNGNGNTGGSVPTDSTSYSSGATVTVKANTGTLTKTGYTFAGWNTQNDGQGVDYDATGTDTFMISANTTLYAKWTADSPTPTSGSYKKITSTSDLKDGKYLIVYETGNVALDGKLTSDVANNTISVSINNSEIASSTEVDASAVTISASNGSILGSGGKYIGHSGTSNTLNYNNAALTNTITFDNGNVSFTNGDYTMKYNNTSGQYRFRYYKSGQQAIQLYKYESGSSANLVSIAVKTAPSKTTYYEGETFDPTGLVITATYDDSSTADIAYANAASDFSFSPSGALATTDNKVIITYKEKTANQAITVNSDTLNSITLGGSVSFTGTAWDLSGVTLMGHYVSGDRAITSFTPTTTTSVPTTGGTYPVTVSVSFGGKSDTKDYNVVIEHGTLETDPLTVAEAMTIANNHLNSNVTTLYYVVGKLTNEDGNNPYNTQYGNFYMNDSGSKDDAKLTVYGVTETASALSKSGDYWSFSNPQDFSSKDSTKDLTKGDKVLLKLRLYKFSGSTLEGDGLFIRKIVRTLSSIAVTTNPTNSQFSGQAFDKTGMVVTATYSDTSTENVTNSVTIEPATLASDTTSVTISYGDKITVYNLDVLTLNKITASGYTETFRAGDTFSFGGSVYPWYTHSSGAAESQGAALDSSEYAVSKTGETLERGNGQGVVVTHTASSKTFSYTIDVDYAYVTGVSFGDDSIELGLGGEATFAATVNPGLANQQVTYSIDTDNTTLGVGEYTLTGNKLTIAEDIAASGEVHVIATTVGKDSGNQSKSATCIVTVTKAVIAQITAVNVSGAVTATEQYVGKDFDYTGLTFTPVWSEGEHDEVTITGADIDWPELTEGMTSITGKYNTGSAELDVAVNGFTIVNDYLNSIEITGDMSNKTYYSNATGWNFAGLSVTGTNASGDPATITQASVEYTANLTPAQYLSTSAEKLVVTATYGGKTDTIDITGIVVNEYKLSKIEVTSNPTKTEYIIGESFSADGLVVKATYSDSSTDPTFKGYTLDTSAIDMYKAGTYTVKVKADGVSDATFDVKYGVVTPQEGYDYWQKVTATQTDWSGEYLLVYENSATEGLVWTGVDAVNCYETADISNNQIESKPSGSASLVVEKCTGGYSVKINGGDNNGKYISGTSNSNTINFKTEAFANTISYDSSSKYSSIIANTYLTFNNASNQMRFRYMKSDSKNVQLYKHVEQPAVEADLIKLNVSCAKTFKEGETLNISDLTISGLYNSGEEKAITTGVTFSDGTSSKVLAPGDNNLTVKYGELTENITITATSLLKYDLSVSINSDQAEYTVSPALTDGKLIGGEDYSIEVSAKEGYVIESVTPTGATASGNVVTITNASSDVSITVTSHALETFDITYNGNNAEYATILPKPATIVEGNPLDLTVTANENKKIDSVVVTMGGDEQIGAYSDGKIHLNTVSDDIEITVNCSYITYEVDFSGSDSIITFSPATESYNQGAEFNVTAEFDEFLYELDLDNSTYSMTGGGTLSLVGNVFHADAVTGDITISLVLKDIPHEVEVDDSVEGYTITNVVQDATGLTVTLALEDHYPALPSSIECSIDGTTGTKSYTITDNKIVIPAADVTGKVTLLTSATHADCSFAEGDIVGVEGSLISSPKDYEENVDYTFTLKEGFDPETLTVTMTSYGNEFTDFDLTKSGDTYHVMFVIVGDTVINVTAKAKITNNLTDNLITTSNTDKTIEAGANYTATLSFADGFDPDKTSVKVEMRDSLGDLKDITTSAYNSSTHGISITGVTGEIVITACTELKQYNVVLSGNNLLDSDYATILVSVDGKPATLVDGSVKVTHGEFIQILIALKDGKQYAEGYPIYTMGGSTEGLVWNDDMLTVDSLTGDLSFVANIEKIGVSAAMQYNVTIIENTSSPDYIYQGEQAVYQFVIKNPKAYEFDQETSKIETFVNGVLTDLTTESGVWYYDDDSGILRITISNPNTHVGIKIMHKDIEYTVTSPESAKFYSLDVPETIHYGDKNVQVGVVADDHCHVDGVKVYLGAETLTVNVDYEYSSGVVTIKEIKGNYVIEATAAHDDVTIALDASSDNITFTPDDPQASYAYETTITGRFSVVAPYKLPISIKVFEYGVEIGNDKYTYSPTTGVFSIKAEGDITIIAKGSLGTVTVGLSDESSVNASLSPTPEPEYDEGASFEATVIVDSGYQITSVVVKMGGSSIKAFNSYDNSIFILNLTDDVEITVVTEKIYCDVNIISYNGYSDGDAISSIEYGLPLEVTFTPYSGYHLDEYDTFVGTMGGEDISAYYSNGVLSIPEVTGTIDVSFQGWPDPYTVTTNLGESTLDTDVHVLEHGDEFFGQVTPNEGYKITSMVVTMGENPVTVTDYGFDISSVTGDVVITVVTEKITHTITNTLTNAINNNTTSPVEYGSQYIANISAAEGYENLTVTVKMGGVDVTSACYSNGVIIISKVTGDIEITASAVASKVNVSVDVTNVTCSIESQQVDYNSALEFTLTQDDNTFDYVYSVTMGGEPVDGLNGVYTIEHVTGEIVIEASATIIELESISASLEYPYNLIDYDSDFPMEWLEVIAHYNNGDSQEVTSGITIEGFERTVSGEQTITVKALGLETTVDVEVLESTVVVNVSANTVEESYDFGYEFTKNDVDVYVEMSDGNTHVMKPDDISGYDITKSGEQSITVYCGEYELQITVKINASTEIESISAVANKDNLTYGDTFIVSDVTVTAKYTDGLTEEISAEYVEFLGAPGKNTVVVHAAGFTCTVDVTVKASEVIDHIDALPNEESYSFGYELKASDFSVTATYTDGHMGSVVATEIVDFAGTPGVNFVTVKVGEMTCISAVKVNESTIVDTIKVTDYKNNLTFGDSFTKDDVIIQVTYTDGHINVFNSADSISGFTGKAGDNIVTVNLAGVTAEIIVTVKVSEVIDHIEAITNKAEVEYDGSFSIEDVSVTYVYTDGHKVENKPAETISELNTKVVGTQTIVVTAAGKTTNLVVKVLESKVVNKIEVSTSKTELEFNGEFTKDDVTVTFIYTDGRKVAGQKADAISGYKSNHSGEQVVTVYAGGNEATLTVTVKELPKEADVKVVAEKIEVEYNTEVNPEDIKITIILEDGTTEVVGSESIEGFDPTIVGEQEVTVNVGGKSVKTKIVVRASVEVDHIEVSLEKTSYPYGYNLTTGDVKVAYVYTDGHKEENLTPTNIEGYNATNVGEQEIVVTAENGMTATVVVTIDAPSVKSLDVIGYNDYVDQGKEYIFNGKVIAYYSDGSAADVTESAQVSKLDTTGHGPSTLKVSFGGASKEITINVVQTKSDLEPYQSVAIIGGSIVGVSAIAVGLFFLLKKFKI